MTFKNLDLNLLRVFDAVMTEQNLTRAANVLAMTQPAVSNALRRLRESLDDELFTRTAYGVRPTGHAEEIWPTVRQALASLQAVFAPDDFALSKVTATFRMAMADSTAALFLPSLMRSIEHEAQGIRVQMVPLVTREPRPLLLNGEIDLAIGSFPGVLEQLSGMTAQSSKIRHQRLYSGEYVCVMRRGHPLASGDLTLDAYCAAHHLQVSFSGRKQGMVDNALAALGRQRTTMLTVNQYFTAGKVIANTDLITVLPRHLVAATGMGDSLISKELPFGLRSMEVDMLWHERDMRSPAHKWVRDQMTAAVAQSRRRTASTAAA